MRILYYNNCWFTNVGEAFIDFGGIKLLEEIFPTASIACISEMTTLYSILSPSLNNITISDSEIIEKCYDPANYFEADYLVFPGMFACKGFVNDCKAKRMSEMMKSNGTKIIFLGMGGELYSEEERKECSKYFEAIRPELIITRDKTTFEYYKNVAECISGLDCAFWIKDVYDPRGFAKKKYDVVTFNRTKEPDLFDEWELPIIRPWHMGYFYKKDYAVDGRLISDTEYDYLTIYANANRVYTDLVHATIPALVYGVPVKYWYVDKRSLAFSEISGLKNDDGWLSIESKLLDRQKKTILSEIKSRIGE